MAFRVMMCLLFLVSVACQPSDDDDTSSSSGGITSTSSSGYVAISSSAVATSGTESQTNSSSGTVTTSTSQASSTSAGSGEASSTTGSSGEQPSSGEDPSSSATSGAPVSSTSGTTSSSTSAVSSSSSAPPVTDPNGLGPFIVSDRLEDTAEVLERDPSGEAMADTNVDVEIYHPTNAQGLRPLVLINHGFQLPTSQYRKYAEQLASHGFVAILVDYSAGFIGVNHLKNAYEIKGVITWALSQPALSVDPNRIGVTGHSLGGKLSFHVGVIDSRVGAVMGLDPVDASQSCNATNCPDVTDMLPNLHVPSAVLGETLDSTGGFLTPACAPADANYQTFYAKLGSPSIEVTINGANHMSFLDDVSSCGMTCSACKSPELKNDIVNALARSYVVAFFRRYLLDETGYDAYLTGTVAQQRYVDTGMATIQSK